jgi:hypothetical protein
MNRISQFFASVKEKLFRKKQEVPKIEHSTIPAPKPKVEKKFSLFSRIRFKKREMARKIADNPTKRIGFGTFTRLKYIGGHRVRFLGRAFKDSFYREYGVRLK